MGSRGRMVVATVMAVALGVTALEAPASAAVPDDEVAFVARINGLRAAQGLVPLAVDQRLTDMARAWAQRMADAGAISHTPNLTAIAPSDWVKLGENVGVGGDVQSLFDAFVASPGHYSNLVEPRYRRVGVGVVWVGATMYTAHEFMTVTGDVISVDVPRSTATRAVRKTRRTRRAIRHHRAHRRTHRR